MTEVGKAIPRRHGVRKQVLKEGPLELGSKEGNGSTSGERAGEPGVCLFVYYSLHVPSFPLKIANVTNLTL